MARLIARQRLWLVALIRNEGSIDLRSDIQKCESEKALLIKSEVDGDSCCPPSTLGDPRGLPLLHEESMECVRPRRSRTPYVVLTYVDGVVIWHVMLDSQGGVKYL
jgi:hypothetical protein